MRHGSLFSGIGGFDLAADWMGWENVFHCEINPFARKILKYYWPKANSHDDIKKTDFTQYRGAIDIVSGGFPCQPFSHAGVRKGREDERFLWAEMCRAIKEIAPTWVIGENVPGIIDIERGLVFQQICVDLENIGYQVWPVIIPACGKNAPHKRNRVFFIAYTSSARLQGGEKFSSCELGSFGTKHTLGNVANTNTQSTKHKIQPGRILSAIKNLSFVANPNHEGFKRRQINTSFNIKRKEREYEKNTSRPISIGWENFPIKSPICSRNDGIPGGLDNITFSAWRNKSIAGFGNAVVPQVVYTIFKTIENFNNHESKRNN